MKLDEVIMKLDKGEYNVEQLRRLFSYTSDNTIEGAGDMSFIGDLKLDDIDEANLHLSIIKHDLKLLKVVKCICQYFSSIKIVRGVYSSFMYILLNTSTRGIEIGIPERYIEGGCNTIPKAINKMESEIKYIEKWINKAQNAPKVSFTTEDIEYIMGGNDE